MLDGGDALWSAGGVCVWRGCSDFRVSIREGKGGGGGLSIRKGKGGEEGEGRVEGFWLKEHGITCDVVRICAHAEGRAHTHAGALTHTHTRPPASTHTQRPVSYTHLTLPTNAEV